MQIKKDIIELETRRRIYLKIKKYPGLHLMELSRRMGIPKSTMVYHLNYLIKRNLITSSSKIGYDRYFIANKFNKIDKEIISLIREKVPRNIIFLLCLFLNISQQEIVAFSKKWECHSSKIGINLKKHPTTLAFHLNKLVELDLIERIRVGNKIRYKLKNPEIIYDLLISYDRRLFGKAVHDVIYWMEHPDTSTVLVDRIAGAMFEILPHPYHV